MRIPQGRTSKHVVVVQPFAHTKDVWTGEMTCDEAFLELIKMLGWQEKLRGIQHLLPESNQDRINRSTMIRRHSDIGAHCSL